MVFRMILYNTFLLVLGIVILPWLIYQLFFVPKRRRGLAQRFGRAPAMEARTIWCHAVSVGEVRAVGPFLSLLQDDNRTRNRVVLSTVTVTGQETAYRECSFVKSIFYFPLDFPFAVNRAIRRVDPEIFITAETEIWPNFFAACFRRKIPVVVVNGRISDKSFSRYRTFRWFFGPILRNVALFLMQSQEDAKRIVAMGADPDTVKVTGNMKYDRVPDHVDLPETIEKWAEKGFLVVAGSTHAGEEDIILEALAALGGERILLALVPRHPERFEEVAALLTRNEVKFTRFSEIARGEAVIGNVILVDAMGVLDGFYALADVAFVGGSLIPVGGHNLLEPAMHGVPVMTGPHTYNFRDITDSLKRADGCRVVEDRAAVSSHILNLYNDPSVRRRMGAAGQMTTTTTRGASERNKGFVVDLLEGI